MRRKRNTTEGRGRTHRCFAGSNTPMLTEALIGRPLLVSYADIRTRPTWWRETLRPLLEERAFPFAMLDSGAFTVISQGIEIDVQEYAAFAGENGHLFDAIINLDSIAGDLAESRHNLETLRRAGVPAIPVFHEGEPWAELENMAAETGYIGIGFARREGGRLKNSEADRRAWLADVFERVGDRCKIHGFAMTRLAGEYPFASVDSTTWIAEYRALRNRTPGRPYTKTHGVGGETAERLAGWNLAELTALAVGSYDRPGYGPAVEDAEENSRGQARTVFRRYGARLPAAIAAVEEARYAEAA